MTRISELNGVWVVSEEGTPVANCRTEGDARVAAAIAEGWEP